MEGQGEGDMIGQEMIEVEERRGEKRGRGEEKSEVKRRAEVEKEG